MPFHVHPGFSAPQQPGTSSAGTRPPRRKASTGIHLWLAVPVLCSLSAAYAVRSHSIDSGSVPTHAALQAGTGPHADPPIPQQRRASSHLLAAAARHDLLAQAAAPVDTGAGTFTTADAPIGMSTIPLPNPNSVSGLRDEMATLRAQHTAAGLNAPAAASSQPDPALRKLGSRLWYLQQRAAPNDTVDWSLYGKAAVQRDQMPPAIPGVMTGGPRTPFGPINTPIPFLKSATPVLNPSGAANGVDTASALIAPAATSTALSLPSMNRAAPRSGTMRLSRDVPDASPVPGAAGPKVNATWQPVGPISPAFSSLVNAHQFGSKGSVGGRINAIAFDPSDTSNNTAFVGAARGGVWVTVNGGVNWIVLTDIDPNWDFLQVSSIAVSADGSKVYVGTGDFPQGDGFNPGFFVGTADKGGTVANAAATKAQIDWVKTTPFGNTAVSKLLIAYGEPSIILATTGRAADGFGYLWIGTLDSTGNPTNWQHAMEAPEVWCDVKYGARGPLGVQDYYATCYDQYGNPGLAHSQSATSGWALAFPPEFLSALGTGALIDIAPSPTILGKVYAMVGAKQTLFVSTNAGANWNAFPSVLSPNNRTPDGHVDWAQPGYDLVLAAGLNTTNNTDDVLYAGLLDIYQSPDSGSNWAAQANVYSGSYTSSFPNYPGATDLIHTDQHAFTFFANDVADWTDPQNIVHSGSRWNNFLVGNDGGVYSGNFSGGQMYWGNANGDLGAFMAHSVACHPTDPNTMLTGLQDNGTIAAAGSPASWKIVSDADGGPSAIHPVNPAIQVSTSQSYKANNDTTWHLPVVRTTDNWQTAHDISMPDVSVSAETAPDDGFFPMAIDPNNTAVLYVGTNYLWKWTDDGTPQGAWVHASGSLLQSLAGSGGYITSITVAPSDSTRIYTGSSDGQLWMSQDTGATWTQIDSSNFGGHTITSIAVEPANPSTVIVGLSGFGIGHVWACGNVTAAPPNWSNVSGNLIDIPVNSVVLDPYDVNYTLYAGTDEGVFYTNNGGGAWVNATQHLALPNVEVDQLQAVRGTGYLVAATYGRGIWRIPLNPLPAPGAGHWKAVDVAVETNNTTHILWASDDYRWELWSVDNFGNTTYGYLYGPYSGSEHAVSIDIGSDDLTRLLLVNPLGGAGFWIMGPDNASVQKGWDFAPVTGWAPLDIAVGSDLRTRMLWYNSSSSHVDVYSINESNGTFNQATNGTTGWGDPIRIGTGGTDGMTRILFKNGSNASLWLEDATGTITAQDSLNTMPGGNTIPVDVTVDGSNNSQILWTDSSNDFDFTFVDSLGVLHFYYTNGTASGWVPKALSAGSDGLLRMLSSLYYNNEAQLWLFKPSNDSNTPYVWGPY